MIADSTDKRAYRKSKALLHIDGYATTQELRAIHPLLHIK
jgi:hypothetical protein